MSTDKSSSPVEPTEGREESPSLPAASAVTTKKRRGRKKANEKAAAQAVTAEAAPATITSPASEPEQPSQSAAETHVTQNSEPEAAQVLDNPEQEDAKTSTDASDTDEGSVEAAPATNPAEEPQVLEDEEDDADGEEQSNTVNDAPPSVTTPELKPEDLVPADGFGPGWYLCIKECQGNVQYLKNERYYFAKNPAPNNFTRIGD